MWTNTSFEEFDNHISSLSYLLKDNPTDDERNDYLCGLTQINPSFARPDFIPGGFLVMSIDFYTLTDDGKIYFLQELEKKRINFRASVEKKYLDIKPAEQDDAQDADL